MKNFPDVVFFKLTSKCNHNCRYCYDSKKHRDMNFLELKNVFKLLSERGVKAIVLSGGEPLIREDISDIFKEIRKQGMKIYLDTNGDFFHKYQGVIDEQVDVLGLPLDYASGECFFRDSKNFDNVIKILEYYSKSGRGPKIRIGTVATKENIEHLENIAELLKKYKIDSWKIYQFIPIGPNAFANKDALLVDSKEFVNKTNKIKEKYSSCFKIIISTREKRSKAYFFISSDGTVFMPKDEEVHHGDFELGNIFDSDIVDKWEKEVHMCNYRNNLQETFNNKIAE